MKKEKKEVAEAESIEDAKVVNELPEEKEK